MKLYRAEIDGFGQLQRKELSLHAPVVVVYGPNEAGKSTVFGFVRTMLYGFAKRGQAAERQEPVNGGRHGGRLFFEAADRETYVLERYAADSSGKPKLRLLGPGGADGPNDVRVLTQAEWEQSYLGGVGERLYRQLFAVTLSELQEVGALSGEELGRYLYQAGWEGGRAIAAAEKRLMQEMDRLFKPRGTNQQMNRQLQSLEQIEAALRKRADAILSYNEWMEQLDAVEAELTTAETELPAAEARLLLLSRACAGRSLWLRKQELLVERAAAAYSLQLPEDADKAWEELLRLREGRRAEADGIRRELGRIGLQLQEIEYEEELIRLGGKAEALLQSSERIGLLKEERTRLETELQEHDDAIARLAGAIAPEWTERRLRELRITTADREYVRSMQQRRLELLRAEERLFAEREGLKREEREAAQALEQAAGALAAEEAGQRERDSGSPFALLPLKREALAEVWNAADHALREWELERAREDGAAGAGRSAGAAGRSGAFALWAAAAGAGGAAVALGAAALSGAWAGAWAGVAALAMAGAALALAALAKRRGGSSARAGSRAEEARAGRSRARRDGRGAAADPGPGDAEQRVRRALEGLLREPGIAADALLLARRGRHSPAERPAAAERTLAQLRAAVEARQESLRLIERHAERHDELARRRDRLREHGAELGRAAAAAERDKQAAAAEWAAWLAKRMLPPEMSPEAALEAFELAGQALQRLLQYDRLAAKLDAADGHIAAFAAQAAELCGPLEEARRQLAADPVLALRLLLAESRRHAAAAAEERGLLERRAALHLSLQAAEAALQELGNAAAARLAAAGIESEAGYEAALAHRQLAIRLDIELSRLEPEWTAGLPDNRIAELEELCASKEEAELQALFADAEAAARSLERSRRDALERRGSLRQSVEHLLQEEEHRRLLEQRAMAISELEADSERYAVLAVSAALIRGTKRIYEEERQPAVLRRASQYISRLTEGKYIRVVSTPGEPGIRLETADRRLIDSSVLSRGTAELVYLAMRFALAEEAAGPVKLPLMLDDVFVNFDRGRLRAVAKLLAELAGERQIIVMTCHGHIRDEVLESCADAELVEL